MSKQQNGRGNAASKKKAGSIAASSDKRDDILRAVILADSFQDCFNPFTLEKPRCLLPLANVPLIEYTLEYLAMNGVHEVFIYCGAHADQIESYIGQSRWNSPETRAYSFTSLEFVRVSDARSLGDFLRDLDKRDLMDGDFIIVHGDLVANIPLNEALVKHKARREASRDAIMTMVLRAAGPEAHHTKTNGVRPVFVVRPSTGRCLHYEQVHPLQTDHYVTLDPHILKESPEFEMRTDLIDCGIDICTPDVLALWSESFDYELPRANFLHGVLKDWELNGKLIYTEIYDHGYAARASDLQQYAAISHDILGRWVQPFVPDRNLVPGSAYRRTKLGTYVDEGVTAGLCTSLAQTMIGKDTCIGSGTVISNSIIGRRCRIGRGVRIANSYVWDDVIVGDNSVVDRAVISNTVQIGADCVIPPGSLISFGISVGAKIRLPSAPVPMLSIFSNRRDSEPTPTDTALVGADGKGVRFREEVESDDEDGGGGGVTDASRLHKSLVYSPEHAHLSASSISTFASHPSGGDEFDGDVVDVPDSSATHVASQQRARQPSFMSDDGSLGAADAAAAASSFHTDATNGLLDALRADDGGDFDAAKLEFMGLRLSHNASDDSVRRAVAAAFGGRAAELLAAERGGLDISKAASQSVGGKPGAAKFVRDVGVGGTAVEDQVEFVLALQKMLVRFADLGPARAGALLSAMQQQLYHLDAVEEDGILAWWEDERSRVGESMQMAREKCRVLIEWLQNADEEESEEEEDD